MNMIVTCFHTCRKFLIIAAFFMGMSTQVSATVYTVTNILDANATTGTNQGDLRYCINQVIANAATGPHTINFNITGVGPFIINAGSAYPAITGVVGGVTVDGFSQAPGTQTTPNVFVNGPGYGECFNFSNTTNSLVQGIGMYNFGSNAVVYIQNNSNFTTIRGCWIGINTAGTAAAGGNNAPGIWILNSANCTIGADISVTPKYKNVIANRQQGIEISGTSKNNLVIGSYIGTNAAGTAGIAISANAIYITDASSNTIGGVGAGQRNIICKANQYGIMLEGNAVGCRSNIIYNNYIGVGSDGLTAIPNSSNNVELKGNGTKAVSKNQIGGKLAGQGNVIAASSGGGGIVMEGGPCDSNLFASNYIGFGFDGTTLLVNGSGTNHHGIYCNGSGSGYNSFYKNVIYSLNRGDGIRFDYGGFDTISYNYVGTDVTGLTAVGIGTAASSGAGIHVNNGGASNMQIIGNVVAMCQGHGIWVDGTVTNYLIKGNKVGMNKYGLGTTFGNVQTGIYMSNGAAKTGIIIGGTNPATDRNIVSRNGRSTLYSCTSTNGYGIILEGADGAVVLGNYVGVDSTGNVAAGNGGSGIMINGSGCTNITIGGLAAGSRNVVCSNGFNCSGPPANVRHGIQFNQNSGVNYQVLGNYVGIGADGTTLLGNSEEGVSSYSTSNITIGGNSAAARNVIAGNAIGVFLQPGITNCKVLGNYIGTDATGMIAKPNVVGVQLSNGATGNVVGGSNPGEGNIISGNTSHGISLTNGAVNNVIQQNYIGVNAAIGAMANGGDGVHIEANSTSSNNNLIGSATNTSLGNIIAYNANGVNIIDGSKQNEIRRNSIYCNGSASVNGINLHGVGNINISAPGPLVVTPYVTAPTAGIVLANIGTGNIVSTDVVEVFYDNSCGTCQGRTYLGNATNGGTGQWSYSPLPAASDCTSKGSASCPSGVKNITATRTDNASPHGNTSQFMSCSPIALPVELISFTAVKNSSDDVLITWYTASEKNNAYFELLRSTDGQSFQPIAKIEGAGNSSSLLQYNFEDQNLPAGIYYYMLIQVDFDGKQSPTSIVQIAMGNSISIEIPTTLISSGDPIKVLNYTGFDLTNISVTDLSGKVISTRSETKETTEFYLDSKGLSSSIYLIRAQTQNEIVVKKIFVK